MLNNYPKPENKLIATFFSSQQQYEMVQALVQLIHQQYLDLHWSDILVRKPPNFE